MCGKVFYENCGIEVFPLDNGDCPNCGEELLVDDDDFDWDEGEDDDWPDDDWDDEDFDDWDDEEEDFDDEDSDQQ